MIPSCINPWKNWNDYVSLVNKKLGYERCQIDKNFPEWLKDELNVVFGSLRPVDRGIVRLRFGLEDGEFWTLCQIAVAFELSRARIQQRLAKVLRTLGHERFLKRTDGMRSMYMAFVGEDSIKR